MTEDVRGWLRWRLPPDVMIERGALGDIYIAMVPPSKDGTVIKWPLPLMKGVGCGWWLPGAKGQGRAKGTAFHTVFYRRGRSDGKWW